MGIQNYTIIPQWYPVVLNLSEETSLSLSGWNFVKNLGFSVVILNGFQPGLE